VGNVVSYPYRVLTPNDVGTGEACLCLTIPGNGEWTDIILGLLDSLSVEEAWQVDGIDADVAAEVFADIYRSLVVCNPVPIGGIVQYAGASVPTSLSGWLVCDGSQFDGTEYPELAGVVGETYGAKSGDLYRLPDLRNNVTVGAGDLYSAGAAGGSRTHTLQITELASHVHGLPDEMEPQFVMFGVEPGATQIPINVGYGTQLQTDANGGAQPHNNMPPYVAVNFIIRAR
jgi:microcystin-dependent protein